jgi:SAM-dependent methyltransferase
MSRFSSVPSLDDWPGGERRHPRLSTPQWAVRAPLAVWLEQQARQAGESYRVLDVGCGPKPYYPFFAERATEYVGVDVVPQPAAELVGRVEELPVEDGTFDLVLCTQVLEHCDDPVRAVSELRRVTAPGGRVLVSTHGVQVYHPSPQDYWRWTHAGLERLFVENAEWESVDVAPGAGTATCLAMLLGIYTEIALRRSVLARPPVWLLNRTAAVLDARFSSLREPRPGSLTANFHLVATVAGDETPSASS